MILDRVHDRLKNFTRQDGPCDYLQNTVPLFSVVQESSTRGNGVVRNDQDAGARNGSRARNTTRTDHVPAGRGRRRAEKDDVPARGLFG